jgi:hypothetical protein
MAPAPPLPIAGKRQADAELLAFGLFLRPGITVNVFFGLTSLTVSVRNVRSCPAPEGLIGRLEVGQAPTSLTSRPISQGHRSARFNERRLYGPPTKRASPSAAASAPRPKVCARGS